MVFIIVIGLLIISFLWALYSLYREERTHSKITHAKNELQKEKILFKN